MLNFNLLMPKKLLLTIVLSFMLFHTAACTHWSEPSDRTEQCRETPIRADSQKKSDGDSETRGVRQVRSCIQEADGYAEFSEDMTRFEARRNAIEDAKKNAREKAIKHIRLNTGMENVVVRPEVRILDQKDYGLEDDHRYHIRIRAEVAYESDLPLKVSIWASKEKYRLGESIEISIRGNRDYYARLFNFDPTGKRVQLLPNGSYPLNLFKAGKVYKIPDPNDNFEFRARPPYGRGQIVIYASEQKENLQTNEVRRGGIDMVPSGTYVGICEFVVEK